MVCRVMDYVALTKPKITVFVALSTSVGFVVGAAGVFEFYRLLHTLLATVLIASGSAVLNQFLERKMDARMERTANRPLPAGRLYPEEAYLFGLLLSGTGILYMGLRINWLAGFLAALTWVIYLFLYTPMKRKSTHNTAVGAIAGALPAHGRLGRGAGRDRRRRVAAVRHYVLLAIPALFSLLHGSTERTTAAAVSR